jgi:hypothetical protein
MKSGMRKDLTYWDNDNHAGFLLPIAIEAIGMTNENKL